MKRIALLLLAVAMVAGVVVVLTQTSTRAVAGPAPQSAAGPPLRARSRFAAPRRTSKSRTSRHPN